MGIGAWGGVGKLLRTVIPPSLDYYSIQSTAYLLSCTLLIIRGAVGASAKIDPVEPGSRGLILDQRVFIGSRFRF